jgi:hypothetical protein
MASRRWKAWFIAGFAQLPVLVLLFIFLHIEGLPIYYHLMGIATVVLEAMLVEEIVGMIIERVEARKKGIVIRGVLERTVLRWEDIEALQVMVVSPMPSGRLRNPTTLLLVKTKVLAKLPSAIAWWLDQGPAASGREGLAGLVSAYQEDVRQALDGWQVIRYRENRKEQLPDMNGEACLPHDGWELSFIEEARGAGYALPTVKASKSSRNASGKTIRPTRVVDATFPTFVKRSGGRYAADIEHVWETVQ